MGFILKDKYGMSIHKNKTKMEFQHCFMLILLVEFQRVTMAEADEPVLVLNTTVKLPVRVPGEKPRPEDWVKDNTRHHLAAWLVDGCEGDICSPIPETDEQIEYEGYDGFYNNLAHPALGAVDTPLLRRVPANYEDSVYKPRVEGRPNPLTLSEKLLKGPIGTTSKTGKTALLVFFGQQVVEEILDAQRPACPPEYINIKIPSGHEYTKENEYTKGNMPSEMPVLRTRYDMRTGFSPNNPRQQLNEITPWLDGGLTYGTTKLWADMLRRDENGNIVPGGLLAASDNNFPAKNIQRLPMANPPPPFHHKAFVHRHSTDKVERFFKLGNPRGNENPFLLVFGVLWFRWHNVLATHMKKVHNNWNDEKIYNEARKWVIASHQHIVVNQWLPLWLNEELPPYQGYNPSIDPQIDQFFQSAAFRFGHTLVPPGVHLRDYGRNNCNKLKFRDYTHLRTCQHYWRPHESISNKTDSGLLDIDHLLMGMASQLSEREDHKIVDDLRERVFGPLEFSRRDLMALNIQRGRDHGIPDYNTAREAFGLPRIGSSEEQVFTHFNAVDHNVLRTFRDLYKNSTDDVDVWVGGILETRDGPGELFTAIIKDQFQRIRDGDRFWYNNIKNKLFTREQIKRLEQLTIYDIIMSVTKMQHNDIQKNPFRAPLDKNDIHPNCMDKFNESVCYEPKTDTKVTCYHLEQLNNKTAEPCGLSETYDYFQTSDVPFILTFFCLGVFIAGLFLVLWLCMKKKQKLMAAVIQQVSAQNSTRRQRLNQTTAYSAYEWIDKKSPLRPVAILLDNASQQVQICNHLGVLLRAIDLPCTKEISLFIITDGLHVMVKQNHDYDLVLKFDSEFLRETFLHHFEEFVTQVGIRRERVNMSLQPALRQAVTRQDRQKRLEKFFRVVFSQAFKIAHSEKETMKVDASAAKEVIYTEVTLNEFAEALRMRPDSEFVHKIFHLVDKDKNGFVSFREFLDMLIIFAKGSADDKIQLMFDMYDINKTGKLYREDFKNMIRSLMETVDADVEQKNLDATIDSMICGAGLAKKNPMDLEDFRTLLRGYKDKLGYMELNFSGLHVRQNLAGGGNHRLSYIDTIRKTAYSLYGNLETVEEERRLDERKSIDAQQEIHLNKRNNVYVKPTIYWTVVRVIQNYSSEIFWITLYTLVLLAIFAERCYYYTVEREHAGLRRIAGLGVTVTRGAASAMMFTYSSLLVTMCRNTITVLRNTCLHIYFPLDSMIFIHKYIAGWALVFTIMHTIGHAINFYTISTQPSDDLNCLFRNYHHSTHEIPKFHYWCWQTITGVTGVLLVILTAIIFIFALPTARKQLYKAFWLTHSLYPLFYLLMILHGAGRFIQEPYLYYFFLGPCVLFISDRLVTVSKKTVEIPVVKAELLPSNVTMLEFKKPTGNFAFKSGQWVRISCVGLNRKEYHAFTISSAPHEPNLTVHIRAVGPWTTNIRHVYDPNILGDKPLPKIHLEGPYGEGHQDWYQFEISILIGGGIGVTPFASILKDIAFQSKTQQLTGRNKIYFLWVTKTQKHFEWLVDIIREVENMDETNTVSVHLFVTQFYQKFDLRTVLLYICEHHFQRVSNRSLFTGLKAATHFGRPHFQQFLKSIQTIHSQVRKVGVFSCGPPPMTREVQEACMTMNKQTREGPTFQHHYMNF